MTPQPLRLLVVDDHPLITKGISSLLAGLSEVKVEAVAHSVAEAKEVLQKQGDILHVALVDIRMQDGMGIDLVRYMTKHFPHIKP